MFKLIYNIFEGHFQVILIVSTRESPIPIVHVTKDRVDVFHSDWKNLFQRVEEIVYVSKDMTRCIGKNEENFPKYLKEHFEKALSLSV